MRTRDLLDADCSIAAKYYALIPLDACIQKRWKQIPPEQRATMRSYIVDRIITFSSDSTQYRDATVSQFISKLNSILIAIVKQDWITSWQTFVEELCSSASVNETVCENNLRLLQMLSEEVFDFGKDTMTRKKRNLLREQYTQDFSMVFELCLRTLSRDDIASVPSLLQSTLKTMGSFVGWVPRSYLFDTTLLEALTVNLLPLDGFKEEILACVSEVAALDLTDDEKTLYASKLKGLFNAVLMGMSAYFAPGTGLLCSLFSLTLACLLFFRYPRAL